MSVRSPRRSRKPLDILVNNAGVMAIQELTLTDRGYEMQLATNHLGHFALALGLHDALASTDRERPDRLGELQRPSALPGRLRRPALLLPRLRPVRRIRAVQDRHVLFAVEATRRWAGDGITANAAHPGGIATALQRHVGGAEYMEQAADRFRQAGGALKTVEQGAATSVLLATSPQLEGIGGRYFDDCNEARVIHKRGEVGLGGVAPYALDRDNAERLWAVSLELIAPE